jgi:PAS domain S-box-containing protein
MVLSVARDISETLAQQRNLAQTLTQLQALIGNLQMGILVESADRHILQSNEFFCKIFGIPDPDILSGLDCSLAAQGAAKHFLDPAGFLSDIDRILAKGATVVNERLHMADGRTLERDYVPVFVHDQFSGNMWIYRDITQQEQHRQQLQETNQRLRTLINATPDIICFKDGKGRWLEANQADLELFCLTEVDYRGKTDRELAAFTDPLYRNAFLACEESDEVCWTSQKVSRGVETIPQVNGPAKVYDVIKVPLFDQQHQRKGLVVLGRDVTDRETLQTQLVRQERLAAVGQLSAGIAHDFNNILASIMGHAELLQFLPQVPGEVLPYCKQIADSSQRAANLVRQILDFSQKTMREPKEIALNQVVEKAVGFLRSTLPENIHIDFTPHPQPLTILGDASQLQQVITNLGVNAKFAMPEGGTLNVSLSLDQMIPQQPCMVCGQTFSGTFATLTVSDTGVGIPQELMAKIFEPFFTTREVGQGSGLGLSQVAGIVSQHKAHLQLTSALGQGSTFRLFFPPHQSLLPQTTPPAKTSSLPLTRGQGELILVVEDDLTVLRTIKAILNHLGYRVLDTETGQEALRLFQQHQAQIGMVLTDMVMPDMDGETLFWKLRAVDPNLKVVVMTGYPLKDRGQTLSQQGVFAWLEKPLSVALLSQTLAEALGHPKGRWG